MIEDIIKDRMQIAGLSQAKLAELSDCTATQMGIFLKGEGFLNKKSFEKCLSVLGIRLDIYNNRLKIAQKAALKLKVYRTEDIVEMSKDKMAKVTGLTEISSLIDVTEEELDKIVSSGIMDYESTFPYFKATVLHLMQTGEKITPKGVEMSFAKLAAVFAIVPVLPILGVSSLIGFATGLLLGNKTYSSFSKNALAPLMVLTKQILQKNK